MAAVLLRMAGLDALDGDAQPQPPDREAGEIVEAVGTGERQPVVAADGDGQAAVTEQPLERGDDRGFPGRFEGLAQQQIARRMVGDRQGVTVAAIAELELALEVGAPQVVGIGACRQRRAVGAVAPDSGAVDQAVAVEHRMHGAPGRQAHVAGKLANEQFADFARAPMRLVALEIDDQPLHLVRQLVGIAHRPARAIGERLEPLIPIAIEDLVAGLAGNAEIAAHLAHALAVEKTGDKA